jgi:ribonuclease H
MSTVMIYTDGACSGNPGPGGWGAILKCGGHTKEISGGEPSTTNNRMELTAAIEGLSALKKKCTVTLVTDSKYVADGLRLGWARKWRSNGWKKADKKPALNSDLWEKLLNLYDEHDVTVEWVKGHNGHPENERCDEMAVNEYKKFI